ncbi:MAG: hypothetical protein WC511_02670 [Candidatus Pacearchaeota archaeon]
MIKKYSNLKIAGATKQQIDTAATKLEITPEEVVYLANEADPTPEHKFEAWIIKQMSFKNIRLPEDEPRVQTVLKNFVVFSNKKKLKHRDINQYPKISDLEGELHYLVMSDYSPQIGFKVSDLNRFPGVTIEQNDEYVVASISDKTSLELLGRGTNWCTREDYGSRSMAESYIRSSETKSVFQLWEKESSDENANIKVKYQFTDDLEQFMDVRDVHVPWEDLSYSEQELIHEMFSSMNNNAALLLMELRSEGYLDNINAVSEDDAERIINMYLRRYQYDDIPDSLFWLATKYKIKQSSLREGLVLQNISSWLDYFLKVYPGQESRDFEEQLENASRSDEVAKDAIAYYNTVIKDKIKENSEIYTEGEEEDPDHPKSIQKRWDDIMLYHCHNDPTAMWKYVQTAKRGQWIPAEKILKKDPEIWEEYSNRLKKEGYLPELIGHEWEK